MNKDTIYLTNLIEAMWNERKRNQELTYKYADMFLLLNVDVGMDDSIIEEFMGKDFCEKAYQEMKEMEESD